MAATNNVEKMSPKNYSEAGKSGINGSYYNSVSTFKNIDIDTSVVSAYDVARNKGYKSVAVSDESALKPKHLRFNPRSICTTQDSKFAHLRKPPINRRKIPQPVTIAANIISNGDANHDKDSKEKVLQPGHVIASGLKSPGYGISDKCKQSIITDRSKLVGNLDLDSKPSHCETKSQPVTHQLDGTSSKHLTLPSQEDASGNNKLGHRRKLPRVPVRTSSPKVTTGATTKAGGSESVGSVSNLCEADGITHCSASDFNEASETTDCGYGYLVNTNTKSEMELTKGQNEASNEARSTCFIPNSANKADVPGSYRYLKKVNTKLKTNYVSKMTDAELHELDTEQKPRCTNDSDSAKKVGHIHENTAKSHLKLDFTNETKSCSKGNEDNKVKCSERENTTGQTLHEGEAVKLLNNQGAILSEVARSADLSSMQACESDNSDAHNETVALLSENTYFNFDNEVIQELTDGIMGPVGNSVFDTSASETENTDVSTDNTDLSIESRAESVTMSGSVDPLTRVSQINDTEKLKSPEEKASIEGMSVNGKAINTSHETDADKPQQAHQPKVRVERTPSYRRRVMARAKSRYKKSISCKECSCTRLENGEIAVCQFCENYDKKMQRSHTSLGNVTTNSVAGELSDGESSDISCPRRTMTPGLPPGPSHGSPRSLRRVQVSSRVELLMSSSLFRKHLKKHEDALNKHTMSYKRFGMRKSVSNLDLSDTLTLDNDCQFDNDNDSVTSGSTYDDDSENVNPLSLSLNFSMIKGNRRHSLTGESEPSIENFQQSKKNSGFGTVSNSRTKSRPHIPKFKEYNGRSLPHYPIPSFDDFRKRLDKKVDTVSVEVETKCSYAASSASAKDTQKTEMSHVDLSHQNLKTIIESNSSENLLAISQNQKTAEVRKKLPDINTCTVTESKKAADTAKTKLMNKQLSTPNLLEKMPQRIRRRPKSRALSQLETDSDHYLSTGDLSDSSQSTPRRTSGKRPRSLISKKSGVSSLIQGSREQMPLSISPITTESAVEGRRQLKVEFSVNRSKSDTSCEVNRGKNSEDVTAVSGTVRHTRHLSLLSDTSNEVNRGHNSEDLTRGTQRHTRHHSLLDREGLDRGDDSTSQCSTQDVGESESTTSFANSTVSDSIVSEVVNEDAAKLLNDTDDQEEGGKLLTDTDDTELDLSRNSKDDPLASVLRSTSDACKITPEAARKRRERKERPYKSDPFSGTEIIPASKRYLLREERAKLKQRRGVSSSSSGSEDVFTLLDGVSAHGELAREDSFPSLEELNEDEEQLLDGVSHGDLAREDGFPSLEELNEDHVTSPETDSSRSWKLKKHVSNVSSLSTDSGVIGQDGSHDSQQSSPLSTLRHSHSEYNERAWQQVLDKGIRVHSASCSDLTKSQAADCVDCSSAAHVSHQQVLHICAGCYQRRIERKKTIQEIMDTEINYGRDLNILKEEFYVPMMKAGLLNKEQLDSIFLNLDELIHVNRYFISKLKSSIHTANQHNDDDLQEVMIGNMFLESSTMFLTFENYCVNQAQAPILLESLERDKELLRIFLSVSQNDNHLLRRMHLKSFLMVPVQRIMRYPLLLDRLHKATPSRNNDKDSIKEAKDKIEDILGHINAKSRTTSVKNRKSSEKHYSVTEKIEVSRVAIETLKWNRKDVCDVITSRLYMTQPVDHLWAQKKCKNYKFTAIHGVLLTLLQPMSEDDIHNQHHNNAMTTPGSNNNNVSIQSAALVLIKEKNGKYQVSREPFMLENCVVSQDPDFKDVFEILEWNKEAFLFKAESPSETKTWIQSLRQQMHNLGCWRKRRNALPNILLNHLS